MRLFVPCVCLNDVDDIRAGGPPSWIVSSDNTCTGSDSYKLDNERCCSYRPTHGERGSRRPQPDPMRERFSPIQNHETAWARELCRTWVDSLGIKECSELPTLGLPGRASHSFFQLERKKHRSFFIPTVTPPCEASYLSILVNFEPSKDKLYISPF